MSTSRETIRGQQRTDESKQRLSTYVVYAVHPKGDFRSSQLIASTEEGAIARTRGTLVHGTGDIAWMRAYYHIAARYIGELNNQNPYPEATDEGVAAWLAGPGDEAFIQWVLEQGEV